MAEANYSLKCRKCTARAPHVIRRDKLLHAMSLHKGRDSLIVGTGAFATAHGGPDL